MHRSYHVYILTNAHLTVLYIGVTNDLERRLHEHRHPTNPSFTAKYRATKLLYYEETDDIAIAIQREKELKGWLRSRKIALIKTLNPTLKDLAAGWFPTSQSAS